MAKKNKVAAQAVESLAVELVDTLPDIANLTPDALNALISAAHTRKNEIIQAASHEREAEFNEAKKSDKVKALKAELKELDKEFSALQKSQSVTYTVPVTFEVNIESHNGGDLLNELTSDDFSDVSWDNLFQTSVKGKLGKSDLPRDAQTLMQEDIDNVLEDACSEALRLTPNVAKNLEAFAKKVNKFTTKCYNVYDEIEIDKEGYCVEDLLAD